MDGYEATRTVFSRIQNLDPENASRIMGLLLIQDRGEKEMIRLAFGPESLLHSVTLQARKELGLSSPTISPPSLSSSAIFSSLSKQNSLPSSAATNTNMTAAAATKTSRLGGFNIPPSVIIPNSSSDSPASSWDFTSDQLPVQDDLINTTSTTASTTPNGTSTLNPASLPFYAHGSRGSRVRGGFGDSAEEFQLHDRPSFLDDRNPKSPCLGPKSPDPFYPQRVLDSLSCTSSTTPIGSDSSMTFPSYWGGSVHRRSCSFSDVLGEEDLISGSAWRPCHYFARGFCKNGSTCRFVHGGEADATSPNIFLVGSPYGDGSNKIDMMEQCHELFRSKSASHQPRFAPPSLPYSKCMNLLLQKDTPRATAAAALMTSEDMHKFGRPWFDRNDLINPASRQIYLTFPADSTFREEDVADYFSMFGPVQDVRIPYQQKRMFGFVTFLYPETVKMILAKGNPHFVCDARVLVKPYKEKGKIPDKFRKQQLDRGEFSLGGTPTGLDSRDPFDLPFGSQRMFYDTQDLLWRRKLEEQADLQQALDVQSRKLMGLQLLDARKNPHNHRALATGSPIPSPTQSLNFFNQTSAFPPLPVSPIPSPTHSINLLNQSTLPALHHSMEVQVPLENGVSSFPVVSSASPKLASSTPFGREFLIRKEMGNGGKISDEDCDLVDSLEHNLPDSPFASPTKGSAEHLFPFNDSFNVTEKDVAVSSANNSSLVTSTSLDIASFKSFNCQIPRFSSGHGAIGVYAGTGSPTCPVGI